jgi:DNA-binding MarR family transcriptional regulator
MATSRLIRRAYDARLVHLNVNLSEAILLSLVDEHGPLSQRQLADSMNMGRPAAGVVVSSLEARRLITRRPDPQDRRVLLVATTPAGSALAERVAVVDIALRAELRAGLSREERATLAKLLTRLQANLAASLNRTKIG